MSSIRYYLVGGHDVWVMECAVAKGSPSMSRSKAMAFATRAAKALGTPGERTHVCVLDDYGCLRSVLPLELHRPIRVANIPFAKHRQQNDDDQFKSENAVSSACVLGSH